MSPVEGSPATVTARMSAVLDACAASTHPLTLAELVSVTGIPKSTLHRLCWNLADLGILERSNCGGFEAGTRLFALGNTNPRLRRLRMAGTPHLHDLVAESGWMANLAMISDDKALIVEELPGTSTKPWYRAGSTRLPLHASAIGKALLSGLTDEVLTDTIGDGPLRRYTGHTITGANALRLQLHDIRTKGVSYSYEEMRTGVCGVAAPISVSGTVVAAVAVVGIPTSAPLQRLVQPVRRTAEAIARLMESAQGAAAA